MPKDYANYFNNAPAKMQAQAATIANDYVPFNMTAANMKSIGDAGMKNIKKNFNPYFNSTAANVNGIISSGATALEFGQDMSEEIKHYKDMSFQAAETMVGGIPSYGGVSALREEASSIKSGDAGKGLVGKGIMSGASLGASIGTAVPVVGNIVGGLVGGAVGAITGIFGKNKAQKEARRAKERAQRQADIGQENYNEDVEDYFGTIDANRSSRQADRNYQSRLFGANVNDPFRTII